MRLGLRDLQRAKLKFGLLGGALALLVFLLLFLSTLSSTLLGFFTGAVQHVDADVLVYNGSSRRNLQASRLAPGTVERVAGVPGVAAAGPIGNTTLTADVGKGLTDLALFGWQPGLPGGPARVSGDVVPKEGEALVDRADEANGFRVGRTITIEPTGKTLRIVGYTTDSRFNVGPTAYTPIATYRDIVVASNPNAPFVPDNLVAVEVAPGTSVSTVTQAIETAEPQLEALSRPEAVASIPGASSVSQSFNLIVGITFVIVVVVTGFFFLILTVQKLRVFTALRAVGATTGYLASSLVVQVVAVVVVAAVLATAFLAVAAVNSSPAFPIGVDVRLVVIATLAVLACSLGVSLVSVRRIARLDPVEAAGVR
ncbi:MAG TPA: ABC transporter permease [Acidimicrobiales bacterium]|nr:ABC transporter permease [Acidimicrobiales bacterium]